MAPPADLRAWIALLEREGELVRVEAEVDPDLEVTEIVDRTQKLHRRTTAMHWQIHKDGRADYLMTDGRMEVAVVLGLDPVTIYAASAPLPKHVDELMLAGFLRGEPVELVRCNTIDLEVPAAAEIVLEGYVERGDLADEGPFGDHTGYD